MSDNPRPITYQSQYTALLADRPMAEPNETVTVAGKHCESGDVLLKDLALPPATAGDVLVVFATGAYNASMGSNYNRIPGRQPCWLRRDLPNWCSVASSRKTYCATTFCHPDSAT